MSRWILKFQRSWWIKQHVVVTGKTKRGKHLLDIIFSKVHHNEYRRLPVEGPQSRSIDHCVHYRFLSPVCEVSLCVFWDFMPLHCRATVAYLSFFLFLALSPLFFSSFSPPFASLFFRSLSTFSPSISLRLETAAEARTPHSSRHRYTFFCRWSRTDEQA